MLNVSFGRLKPTRDTHVIHFNYTLEHFSMDKKEAEKNNHLEMRNIKQTELQETEKQSKAENKMQKRKIEQEGELKTTRVK